ncbi:serine aminopeptidase domain-containing protein [Spiroplasma tabanidicola]|uniref:Serine aminopeptidase S33 domain-containing protein n=1 Tax=Spiroplasma tabanidicola TaxID=324079 RepID=A0A6I6C9D1_9MOLU|nr:alpha/beta hydrolase [Spiroplasma tabanidicola]QGS52206.1 hypothetical protein STABA_v1c08510 [Spiroplasma tabanidicola]
MVWEPLLELITPIFYIIGATFLFFIFLYFLHRFIKMSSLKFKTQAKQRGEFVDLKSYKTKDGYDLSLNGQINKKNKKIIISIHDFKSTKNEYDNLISYFIKKNLDIDIIAYDQRGCGKNAVYKDASQATFISDLDEIIESINEKYPKKKIILLTSGFSSHMALYFSSNPKIEKIIITSFKINKGYRNGISNIIKCIIGFIFYQKIKLKDKLNGIDLIDDEKISKEIDVNHLEKGTYTFRETLQNYIIKRRTKKYINNAKCKITLILPNLDIYTKQKKLAKFINKLDKQKYKLNTLKDCKHFWLYKYNEQNFENIISKI